MRKFPCFNAKGQEIGHIMGSTYISERNYNRGHIFYKFNNAVGLDVDVFVRQFDEYKRLTGREVTHFRLRIRNFPDKEKSYWIEIALENFLKYGTKRNFDREHKYGYRSQVILSIHDQCWRELEQEELMIK